VIEAHRATRESHLYANPSILTGATNRHLLQPTEDNRKRRKSKIKEIQENTGKGKNRHESSAGESSKSKSKSTASKISHLLRQESSSSSSSANSNKSELVDLVVEDREAEDVERVRARKEGGSGWNEVPPKHFV
jgi:hypothetical protein